MLRWLVLDLNSFFASCEQQDIPTLRGKPVIVVPTMAETTCAIAASYQAKAFGIKTGTLVHEARKLCPEVQLVLARHKRYIEFHHHIITAIEKYIPVQDVMSIDEVACRLDRKQQDPSVARVLAQQVKDSIRQHVGECLTSSVGIAANKLLAKLASNMQKPDGLVVLPLDQLPYAILHLSLRDIPGIGPNMEDRLNNAGISDIAGLWAAPSSRLRLIWGGVAGTKMHGLLHGEDIVSLKQPRSSISHQHVLAPVERSKEGAGPVLRQLVVRAAQRLRDDKFYAQGLGVFIKWSGEQGYWEDKSSFQEIQDTGFLLRVFENIWEKAPRKRPLRVGIALFGLSSEANHQPDLFDKPRNSKLGHAIDSMNEKFGRGAITFGMTAPDHGRKIAFQSVPKLGEV